MHLAYSISGYKQPGQFRWLFDAIWHEDDHFAVHIDAKTPEPVFDQMRDVVGSRDNAFFIERESVVWMGMGLVHAELRAIRALLQRKPAFDYLISLSMQDYPLQPREKIVEELAADPGRNYVTCFAMVDQPFHIRRRPYLVSFEMANKLVKTPLPRPLPRGLGMSSKGSWWRVLSRGFCEWLIDAPETQRYLDFFKHVQAPDELLFQNLLMHGPFRDKRADRNRHHVIWTGAGGSPDTLTMAHAETLTKSRLWFARKFDEAVDRDILELLAERIAAPVPAPVECAA